MSVTKKVLLGIFISLIIAIVTLTATVLLITNNNHINKDKLITPSVNVTVLDANNSIIKPNLDDFVPISKISDNIIKAFVSLEDKRFYTHNGLDYKRIAKALFNNITSFSFKEGASTISQQLIKNTHLSSQKTIKRKLIEAKLALELEKQYSKDQILEMYLNAIYFGNGIYGIDNACRSIFNKAPLAINIEEAATLAGIVKNPKKYSPLQNIEESTKRRDIVLSVMEKNEVITNSEYLSAIATKIIVDYSPPKNNPYNQYYSNVIDQACEILNTTDKDIVNSGVIIKTYLDKAQQLELWNKLSSGGYNPYDCHQLAIILDNNSVGVSAYHSNYNLLLSRINRQVGSLIKPFASYLPILESNAMSPASRIIDEPININGYSPGNFDHSYHGEITLREALIRSYNIPAVKLLQQIGVDNAVELLSNLNITVEDVNKNLSLALGVMSASPLDIIGAYATLANGGSYLAPSFIESIYSQDGECLYARNRTFNQVFSKQNSYIMTDMLIDCAKRGTASKLQYLPYQIAAKTGTVGDNDGNITDTYSCAYTRNNTLLTWQGATKLLPTTYGGGGYPTQLIKDIMTNCLGAAPDFVMPEGVYRLPISYGANGEIFNSPSSTDYELFTNLTKPDPQNNPIALNIEDGSITLRSPSNLEFHINKLTFWGANVEIYKGITSCETTNIDTIIPDSFMRYQYELVIDNKKFVFEY